MTNHSFPNHAFPNQPCNSHQAPQTPLENKAYGPELAGAQDDMARSFEAYRDVNDARLLEFETRRGVDALTAEKLARIDRALDEQKARLDRLVLKGDRPA